MRSVFFLHDQAIYNYPSLGRTVTLCVTYAELQKECKINLAGGEREAMLESFCEFQKAEKKRQGKRWDLALLLSGTDMYGLTPEGRRSDRMEEKKRIASKIIKLVVPNSGVTLRWASPP